MHPSLEGKLAAAAGAIMLSVVGGTRINMAMIKALLLLIRPAPTWEGIATAGRGILFALFLYLLPLILLTSGQASEDRKVREARIEACLNKPARKSDLYNCIVTLLGSSARKAPRVAPMRPDPTLSTREN